MDDAVAHVELDHFAAELASRIASELEGQPERSIPYLLQSSQHVRWGMTFQDLSGVVGGGFARNAQDGKVLPVDDAEVDHVGLDHLAKVARKSCRRSRLCAYATAAAQCIESDHHLPAQGACRTQHPDELGLGRVSHVHVESGQRSLQFWSTVLPSNQISVCRWPPGRRGGC